MPELPEVETTLRGIKPYILHQTVASIIVRHPTLRWPIPKKLHAELAGKIVKNIQRRGKYLLFLFENGTLILHLGMSGRLHILTTPQPPKKHDHVDMCFSPNICLRFTDPRRFGALLWTAENPDLHPLLINIGPEPLSRQFNGDYLFHQSRSKKIAIKSFIMNSAIVAGVGNIYATEALFQIKLHPQKPAGNLNRHECDELVSAIKLILKKAIAKGGTTLKDFAQSDGKPGYFSIQLKAYGNEGLPCPYCQTTLSSVRLNQRSTVYCKKCQTL